MYFQTLIYCRKFPIPVYWKKSSKLGIQTLRDKNNKYNYYITKYKKNITDTSY